MIKVKRAIISVYNKEGVVSFAKELSALGIEIFSTGGTSKLLKNNNVKVKELTKYTNFKQMLDGRVKTLHPKIHAGILAKKDNPEHLKQLEINEILTFDMIVVDLYPFKEVSKQKHNSLEKVLENIDIGGSTMLRAAAKNFKSVVALAFKEYYDIVIEKLKENNCRIPADLSREIACKVFSLTSEYDRLIYKYLASKTNDINSLPENVNLDLEKIKDLRYGENPHQKAAVYKYNDFSEIPYINKIHGKQLSFNNILDLDAALKICKYFDRPTVNIIKHNNPCGIACSNNLADAFIKAYNSDPISAFGSIIGFNKKVNEKIANLIKDKFVECIIAPDYQKKALDILKRKKNLRIIQYNLQKIIDKDDKLDFKKITGGFLIQESNESQVNSKNFKVVTKKKPSDKQLESLLFGFKAIKFVTSNAIIICKGTSTVGLGIGQPSRVDAVRIAIEKAGEKTRGANLVSDAFFPMPDSIYLASKAGINAIIQPGGSIKDKEIIKAADENNIAMVFTGMRHFKH